MVIKRAGMFTRKPELDRSQFSRHWASAHRRIATSMPGMGRYIQNHTFDPIDQPFVTVPSYQIDGLAEMWWPSIDAMEATFASESGRLRLQYDEPNFMGSITIFVIEEDGECISDGATKVICPMRARAGKERAAEGWRNEVRGTLPNLLRSVEGKVLEARTRLHLPPDQVVPDCFLELRFETVQHAEAAVFSPEGRRMMSRVGEIFEKFGFVFVAEHRVI